MEGALGRWSSTREVEMPLRTNHVHDLWGDMRREPLRSRVQGRVPLSLGGRVSERYDSLKERDQAEDDLKAEGVDLELCLNNVPRNSMLASDDVPEKQGLNTLCSSPIYL